MRFAEAVYGSISQLFRDSEINRSNTLVNILFPGQFLEEVLALITFMSILDDDFLYEDSTVRRRRM